MVQLVHALVVGYRREQQLENKRAERRVACTIEAECKCEREIGCRDRVRLISFTPSLPPRYLVRYGSTQSYYE